MIRPLLALLLFLASTIAQASQTPLGQLSPELLKQASTALASQPEARYSIGTAKWAYSPIRWYYNDANRPAWFSKEQVVAAANQAMREWEANCGVRFEYMGETAISSDYFVKIRWVQLGASLFGSAGTIVDNSEYIGSDTKLNPDKLTTHNDLITTLRHEIGHVFGMAHSDSPGSVMTASWVRGQEGVIGADDIAGCQAMYGTSPKVDAGGLALTLTKANGKADYVAAVSARGVGTHHIYIVAQLAGTFYARTANGWEVANFANLVEAATITVADSTDKWNWPTASASIPLVAGIDPATLPADTTIYVGYGQTFADVVRTGNWVAIVPPTQ